MSEGGRDTERDETRTSRRALLGALGAGAVAGPLAAGAGAGDSADSDTSGLAARSVQAGASGWPMVGHDAQNTGHAPNETMPTGRVGPQWQTETGGEVNASPAVVDGTVYVGSNDGSLYALDAADGERLWRTEIGGSVTTSPAVVNGTVYAGSGRLLYALDAGDGSEQWRYRTPEYEFNEGNIQEDPTVFDGTVYVGSEDRWLYALDAGDGTEQWRNEIGEHPGAPAVADGTVVTKSDAGSAVALDAATGERRWTEDEAYGGTALVSIANGTAFIPGDFDLLADDLADGSRQWAYTMERGIQTVPAVADGTVYVGAERVRALSASDGTEQWNFTLSGEIPAALSVADGYVVVTGYDGTVYALDAATGDQAWVVSLPDAVTSTPAVADGSVFLGCQDQQVYALVDDPTPTPTDSPTPTPEPTPTDSPTPTRTPTPEPTDTPTSEPTPTPGNLVQSPDGGASTPTPTPSGRVANESNMPVPTEPPSPTASPTATRSPTPDARQTPTLTPGGGSGGGGGADGNAGIVDATGTQPGELAGQQSGGSIGGISLPVDGLPPAAGLLALVAGGGAAGLAWRYRNGGDDDPDAGTDPTGSGAAPGSSPDTTGGGSPGTTSDSADGTGSAAATDTADAAAGSASTASASPTPAAGVPDELGSDGDGLPTSVPRAPELDLSFDDIEQVGTLGAGGNADVYEGVVGTDDGEVRVALKQPRFEGTLHRETVERFAREAETWAGLDDHDNVVGVIDWGTEPLPWLALEYMDGGDLSALTGSATVPQALWTAHGIAEGVRHAHTRGVAHLDLKPDNVLLRESAGWPVPKVADWGLARLMLEHSRSVEGMTPAYAAPEQFDDSVGEVGQATDIYQLGAVLYELFTGQPPFEGAPATVMNSVLTETPTPPREVAPDLPAEAATIVGRAMAKDPADRYEDVLYLRDDLGELLEALS